MRCLFTTNVTALGPSFFYCPRYLSKLSGIICPETFNNFHIRILDTNSLQKYFSSKISVNIRHLNDKDQ